MADIWAKDVWGSTPDLEEKWIRKQRVRVSKGLTPVRTGTLGLEVDEAGWRR